jgi:hypothetical protein
VDGGGSDGERRSAGQGVTFAPDEPPVPWPDPVPDVVVGGYSEDGVVVGGEAGDVVEVEPDVEPDVVGVEVGGETGEAGDFVVVDVDVDGQDVGLPPEAPEAP